MPIDNLQSICECPSDSKIQVLIKVSNNLSTLFASMADDFEPVLINPQSCGCTDLQILQAINQNIVNFGRVYTGGGGAGTVESVNSIGPDVDGNVLLSASDVGAVAPDDDTSFTGDNTFGGLNIFSLIPNVSWTSKATGSSTSTLNTQYYISTFNANTTISSYVGTPANGSKVAYLLQACTGTNTFTFPAAQRSGDATGTSTVLTPTPGTHMVVFTYVNGAWVYQDDIVLAGVVTSGTFTVPITTNQLTLAAYEAYNKVLCYGATGTINLPVGVSGMNVLIYNTGAFTITIDPNGSEVIVRDGTAQTGGVSMTLSSGAGNYVGMYHNGTCWITLGFKGILSVGS